MRKSKRQKTQQNASSVQKKNDNLELNYHCLVHVMEYLPICDRIRCERVSKFWRDASRQSWRSLKKLDLREKTWGKNEKADVYFSYLNIVLSRCGEWLTRLDLSNNVLEMSWRKQSLRMLSKCPNLKELDLSGVQIGVGEIRAIPKYCEKLESLKLSQLTTYCDGPLFQNHLFSKLNLRCFHFDTLSHFSVDGSFLRHLKSDFIEEISYKCSSWLALKLSLSVSSLQNFKKLHTLEFGQKQYFGPEEFRRLSSMQNLKVLKFYANHSGDNNLIELSPLGNCLKSLTIIGNDRIDRYYPSERQPRVTDISLDSILSSSSIEHLVIRDFYGIRGTCLTNVHNLKTLDCHHCINVEEQSLIILLINCENLEYLDASFCSKITESFIKSAITIMSFRKNDVKLRINLYGTKVSADIASDNPLLKFEFRDRSFT